MEINSSNNPAAKQAKGSWPPPTAPLVIAIVVTAILTALFVSALIPPLVGMVGMGIAIVRSAYRHRQESWVSGLILGLLFAIFGLGGIIEIVFF